MITLISGRRYIDDYNLVCKIYQEAEKCGIVPSTIIHGNAIGFDIWSNLWTKERSIERRKYPISKKEWDISGRKAGCIRNQMMLDLNSAIDVCIFAWDGKKEGGTWNMLKKVRNINLYSFVFRLGRVSDYTY